MVVLNPNVPPAIGADWPVIARTATLYPYIYIENETAEIPSNGSYRTWEPTGWTRVEITYGAVSNKPIVVARCKGEGVAVLAALRTLTGMTPA